MDGVCVQQIERNHLLSLPRLLNRRMMELRQQFLARPRKGWEQTTGLQQNLFGSASKKENVMFAEEELNKVSKADSERWNFNMNLGEPMEGPYHWQLLQQETQQALDTSGRLTCLTTTTSSPSASGGFSASASPKNFFAKSSSSSSSSSSSPSSSPPSFNTNRAVTTTTFSTSTVPTAAVSKKCVKRLQKSNQNTNNKVPKLITDYFKESKPVSHKNRTKEVLETEDKDVVSNRIVEILKIRSMNVR